ncbi:hypothetical protein N665_0186s0042 [Sinapis alba]|nr:hypothetical protein N665_0186s0042 [Sinapis alba]
MMILETMKNMKNNGGHEQESLSNFISGRNLVNVVILRPNPDHDPTPGVEKVFLEYADVDDATKAKSGMNRRKFKGNQVVAVYPRTSMHKATTKAGLSLFWLS